MCHYTFQHFTTYPPTLLLLPLPLKQYQGGGDRQRCRRPGSASNGNIVFFNDSAPPRRASKQTPAGNKQLNHWPRSARADAGAPAPPAAAASTEMEEAGSALKGRGQPAAVLLHHPTSHHLPGTVLQARTNTKKEARGSAVAGQGPPATILHGIECPANGLSRASMQTSAEHITGSLAEVRQLLAQAPPRRRLAARSRAEVRPRRHQQPRRPPPRHWLP